MHFWKGLDTTGSTRKNSSAGSIRLRCEIRQMRLEPLQRGDKFGAKHKTNRTLQCKYNTLI